MKGNEIYIGLKRLGF